MIIWKIICVSGYPDPAGPEKSEIISGKTGERYITGRMAALSGPKIEYRDEFRGQWPWDQKQVHDWVSSLTEGMRALAARNILVAAFIAIDKARAYPEKLPADGLNLRRFRSAVYSHPDVIEPGLIDAKAIGHVSK